MGGSQLSVLIQIDGLLFRMKKCVRRLHTRITRDLPSVIPLALYYILRTPIDATTAENVIISQCRCD